VSVADDLEATPGDAYANTYADLVDANGDTGITGYLEGRLDAGAWNVLTADQQARLLMQATSIIATLPLIGTRHGDSQNLLHFPTSECYDADGALYIPTEVMQATIELALAILTLSSQPTQAAALQASGVSSVTEGALSVSFGRTGSANEIHPAWAACYEGKRRLRTQPPENEYRGWLANRAIRRATI